uniref:Uncharacterized protein n=2 Tax=Colobinae TaxID=9569 RepID=A0A2K5IF91_COLAP
MPLMTKGASMTKKGTCGLGGRMSHWQPSGTTQPAWRNSTINTRSMGRGSTAARRWGRTLPTTGV